MSKADTVTVTGAQFKSFYNDPAVWGANDEWYIEELMVRVNGSNEIDDLDSDLLKDDDLVEVTYGTLCWQGRGDRPLGRDDHEDIVGSLNKWLKDQNNYSVLLTLPKDADTSELVAALKKLDVAVPDELTQQQTKTSTVKSRRTP